MVSYLEERIELYDQNYRMGNALITNQQIDNLEANLYRDDPKLNTSIRNHYCHYLHYLKTKLKNF